MQNNVGEKYFQAKVMKHCQATGLESGAIFSGQTGVTLQVVEITTSHSCAQNLTERPD